MNELLIVLTAGVAAVSALPVAADLPDVARASLADLIALHFGRQALHDADVVAVYDARTETILLRPDWTVSDRHLDPGA